MFGSMSEWLLVVGCCWSPFFASQKKTCADSVKRSCQAAGMKSFLGTSRFKMPEVSL